MTMIDHAALTTALDRLPARYPGPGGVAGVVHQGQVVAARAWGHADVETALPMARTLRLPICSISKQFTCAALLASIGDPARLNHRLRAFLPAAEVPDAYRGIAAAGREPRSAFVDTPEFRSRPRSCMAASASLSPCDAWCAVLSQ